MPTKDTTHSRLVAGLVEQGCFSSGCRNHITSAIDKTCPGIAGAWDWDCIIPDAVFIDHDAEIVSVYEVEVSSPMSMDKIARYTSWWWFLDNCGWGLRLFSVDRHGTTTEIRCDPHRNSDAREVIRDGQWIGPAANRGMMNPEIVTEPIWVVTPLPAVYSKG